MSNFGYFMLFVSFISIFEKIQEKPFLEKLFSGSFSKYPKVKDCIRFFHFLLPIFFFITAFRKDTQLKRKANLDTAA